MSEKGASLPSVRSAEQSSQAQQEVEWVDGGQKKKKREVESEQLQDLAAQCRHT